MTDSQPSAAVSFASRRRRQVSVSATNAEEFELTAGAPPQT